jgi:hypothetical protein
MLNFNPDLRMILNKIYGLPASVSVITQIHGWKYGKTDFGFLLTELTRELDLIDEFASNTETYGEYKLPLINDFVGYDRWLIHNKRRKMFIYDEVIESSQRRRAMSSINIQWVKRIPQLSKGKCHIVAITQAPRLTESTFFNWTFLRGIWTKLSKTVVEFKNPQWFDEAFEFSNIRRTKVEFDQYQIATFLDRGGSSEDFSNNIQEPITDEDKAIVDFINGMMPVPIAHKYKVDKKTVYSWIIKRLNERRKESSHPLVVSDIQTSPFNA